ncbi:hypothetical protein UlMin_021844 [Ulmus minor]
MAFPPLPIGYRFHPTDEELICHYLRLKMLGVDDEVDDVIADVDICKWEPWELPGKTQIFLCFKILLFVSIFSLLILFCVSSAKSSIPSDDSEWFFLCPRKSKSSNSNRSDRSTKTGYWKITGRDRKIKDRTKRVDIGKKKTLVFYKGRVPGKRTNWVIHEYYPEPDVPQPDQKPYVICRLKQKTDENDDTPNRDEGEPSANIASDFEMQTDNVGLPMFYNNEPGEMNLDSILPSFQRSPIHSDQEIDNLPPSGYSNDFMAVLAGDETEEDPTDFVNRCLNDDPYDNFNGETTHNIFNDRSMPISSKRAYFQDGPSSSDTDTEEANGRYVQTLGSSSSFGELVGSKKIRHMQVVRTLDQTVRTSMVAHSVQKPIVAPKPPEMPREPPSINVIFSEEISRGVSKGGYSKRIQMKPVSPSVESGNKGKEAATCGSDVDLPKKKKEKEMSIAESNNERKIFKGSNAEKHSKSARLESSSIQGKSLFVYVDTSSVSSLKSRPRAEYIFNALVGVLLCFCSLFLLGR